MTKKRQTKKAGKRFAKKRALPKWKQHTVMRCKKCGKDWNQYHPCACPRKKGASTAVQKAARRGSKKKSTDGFTHVIVDFNDKDLFVDISGRASKTAVAKALRRAAKFVSTGSTAISALLKKRGKSF